MTGRSRYPGTRPFGDTPEDRELFFGREAETEQLFLRVLSVPLLVLFGRSGLGKTSLLQAGLFPHLRERTFLPVMVRLNVPGDAVAATVGRCIDQACEIDHLEPPRARAATLRELLAATTIWRGDVLLTPVLVFDQFEEVFTLHEPAFRASLAAEIGRLPGAKVVISLREDFLGALEELSAQIPNLFHERLRVEPFTEAAAREAITRPAKLVEAPGEVPFQVRPFELDAATLDQMIVYLRGRFGLIEPFQLQLLCRYAEAVAARVGEGADPERPIPLSSRSFAGGPRFENVLRDFYRGTLKELPPPQRRRARRLCEEGLLDRAGHRLMLEEGQIRNEYRVRRESLNVLAQERILRRERRLGSFFYEISHDRLAESIQQSRGFRIPRRWRGTLWTVGVAVPLLVGVLLLRAAALERARAQADGARANAEALLGVLFSEGALEKTGGTGSTETLGRVRDAASTYLRSASDAEPLNRSRALAGVADLQRLEGKLAPSIKSYGEALEVARVRSPHPPLLRHVAWLQERLGNALLDQGKLGPARSAAEESVRGWRTVIASPQSGRDDCTGLGSSLVSLARQSEAAGETRVALSTLAEATRLAVGRLIGRGTACVASGAEPTHLVPRLDAAAAEVLGRAAVLQDRLLGRTDEGAGPVQLAMEGQRRRGAAEAVRGEEADTPVRRRERAAVSLSTAEAILACRAERSKACQPARPLEEAEAASLDALYSLQTLAALDPTNRAVAGELASAFSTHSRVLAAGGRSSERLSALRQAEQLLGAGQQDRADLETDRRLAQVRVEIANALMALDRGEEAKEMVRRSINTMARLVAVKPENPIFAADTASAQAMLATLLRKAGDEPSARMAETEAARFRSQADSLVNRYQSAPEPVGVPGSTASASDSPEAREKLLLTRIERLPAAHRSYDELRKVYLDIAAREHAGSTEPQRGAEHSRSELAAWTAALRSAQLAELLAPPEAWEEMQVQLRRTLGAVGEFLDRTGRHEDALAIRGEEVAVAAELVDASPQRAEHLAGLAEARFGLAGATRDAHRPGWEALLQGAIAAETQAAQSPGASAATWKRLGQMRTVLASDCQLALHAFKKAASMNPADEEARESVRQLQRCAGASPAGSDLSRGNGAQGNSEALHVR
ncbi:MAG TPA: hypothetical protein VLT82_10550 [Myxococcaceae bacterium]|nr:hypothetical protein [Myxococcaceae bacterium]